MNTWLFLSIPLGGRCRLIFGTSKSAAATEQFQQDGGVFETASPSCNGLNACQCRRWDCDPDSFLKEQEHPVPFVAIDQCLWCGDPCGRLLNGITEHPATGSSDYTLLKPEERFSLFNKHKSPHHVTTKIYKQTV